MSVPGPDPREHVKLHDGSRILIRPIAPADRELLLAGFQELSPDSRYRRFFTPLTTLDPGWLTYLTTVDHHDHEALIAESGAGGEPVGVARYIRVTEQPTAAEVALAVVDRWQGKGVGSALLALLSRRAQSEGIRRFHATCLAENRAVLELFRAFSSERSEKASGNVVEIDMDLPAQLERGNPLHAALTHAAAGTLTSRHPTPTPHAPSDARGDS
jgi:RimJ/RimL family protein N-acetyltransferase